jgi:hypothetical protein
MTAFLALPLDSKLELANLEEYGPVLALLGTGQRPPIWDSSGLIRGFRTGLSTYRFDPGLDHIVLSGPAVYLAILMVAVWEYMNEVYPDDTGASFLVYDGSTRAYKELRIPRARKL